MRWRALQWWTFAMADLCDGEPLRWRTFAMADLCDGGLESVLTTYKIVFGYTIINSSELFQLNNAAVTRGHHYKLVYIRSNCDTRRHFLSNRVVRLWNKLPANTNFSTLTNFKQCINDLDFNIHCVGKR
jgi:hypothetical protein